MRLIRTEDAAGHDEDAAGNEASDKCSIYCLCNGDVHTKLFDCISNRKDKKCNSYVK